jgi:hypothetical protein
MDIEDLLRFIDQLRLAGFDISTQQYVAAQNVLIGLAAHGCWPTDQRALRTWLAPIICSSPHEQENFYRRFDHWVEQRMPAPTPNPRPTPRPDSGLIGRYLPALSGFVVRPSARNLRRFVVSAVVSLAVIAGILFIPPLVPRTLSGRVVDKQTKQPVGAAQVSFGNKNSVTSSDGTFSISYRPKDLPQDLTVACENYETTTQRVVSGSGSVLIVDLQKVAVSNQATDPAVATKPSSPSTPETRTLNPPPPVVPIPLLTPTPRSTSRAYWRWIGFGAAALPLALFGLWLLWQKKLRQALLERLRTAARPRLEEIVVKGAAGQLFMGQTFRRTIQELRRHRQKGAAELDIQRTVDTTINRGGLFSPRYGARQTLPEYLVLIDRAGFEDQHARLNEEIVRRLVQDNVFVDAYFFHGDPRVCRRRDNNLQYVQLQDLAALHPDHHLVIFTDGASFIDPVSGAPETWLEMFSTWAKRVILTPEPVAYWGRRELILTELEFLVLPATQDGLTALSESVDGGLSPAPDADQQARPYPDLMRERERRWLEDHDPRPAEAEELCDQLKLFLGSKGFFWLSACAVYPVPHWDLTLYFGFKLFADRTGIEERLLSLVRLPWFRYGAMPEWLRLRLISEMSQDEEHTVRRVLEELFLTVLEQPPEGIHIEFAPAEKSASRFERLRKQIARWKFKRLFWRFLKDETVDSPLRDYVFVSFMAGRKPRKLAVSLPAAIRRIFFPEGQAALGFRPASAFTLSIVGSLALFLVTWQVTQRTGATPRAQFYLQMSSSEKTDFLRERISEISKNLDGKAPELNDEAIASVKRYVDSYAYRVGNRSSDPGSEDLSVVLARGSQLYAPPIISAFKKKGLSPLLGLYVPMSYTDFLDDPAQRNSEFAGIFQLTATQARDYGFSLADRMEVTKAAPAAAEVLEHMRRMIWLDTRNPSVLILSYKRGPYQIRTDTYQLYRESDYEPTCWDFQANAAKLDAQFQSQDIVYVPKFFAAAVVGENPQAFGLDMKALSKYAADPTPVERRIADLIARFSGDNAATASDELVKLYAENKAAVVTGLVNAITQGPNQSQVIQFAARTLGLIPAPGWDGTAEQFGRVLELTWTSDYKNRNLKEAVDKAVANFNVKNVIDCDCANLEFGLLTSSFRAQCSRVEADLIRQFRTIGEVSGKCDRSAQGPNAKPSDQAQRPASPRPQVTAGSTSSPRVTTSPVISPGTSPTLTTDTRPSDPTLALMVDPRRGKVNDRITVTARTNFSVKQYRFDFGDGRGAVQANPQVVHSYSKPGTYTVSVKVDLGATGRPNDFSEISTVVRIDGGDAFVPDLRGQNAEFGDRDIMLRTKLLTVGLDLGNVTYEESEKPANTVIRQNPAPGTLVQSGTKIDIVVAKSLRPPEDKFDLVVVPKVVGQSVFNAQKKLSGLGLNSEVDKPKHKPPKVTLVIVSQTPVPGAQVTRGTLIRLKADYH